MSAGGGMPRPRIVELAPKWIVGMRETMTLATDATPQLWQRFMPRRFEVEHRTSDEYISLRIYAGTGVEMFAPDTEYEKWAAVEVAEPGILPKGMARHRLDGGTYAVFRHTGPASAAPATFTHIFGVWLPPSGYMLADREHFEVLPEGYDPMDPDAEEDIWVPVTLG